MLTLLPALGAAMTNDFTQNVLPPSGVKDSQERVHPQERLTLAAVTHDEGSAESIGQELSRLAADDEELLFLVEGSLYLGDFLPKDVSLDRVCVMLEPPEMFIREGGASTAIGALYTGGRGNSDSSRGYRRPL